MKEKNILNNILKFLAQHDRYCVSECGDHYAIHGGIKLNLDNTFNNYGLPQININLTRQSITYDVKEFANGESRRVELDWDSYSKEIIKQLKYRVERSLDAVIKEEDNRRLQKSRNCRANRRLMQLMEAC